MPKYRKKPVEIEAFQLSDTRQGRPEWYSKAIEDGVAVSHDAGTATIKTLEGDHLANADDYIIRGVKGEIYPCKPDIFEMTYDKVNNV